MVFGPGANGNVILPFVKSALTLTLKMTPTAQFCHNRIAEY